MEDKIPKYPKVGDKYNITFEDGETGEMIVKEATIIDVKQKDKDSAKIIVSQC